MNETAPASRTPGNTLHLTPEGVWLTQRLLTDYRPDAFDREGFVHCTDGEELVIKVGNRYYRDDARPYVVLDVDLSRVSAPVVYEDDARRFPHICGPIERDAVTRVRRIERDAEGTFLSIGALFEPSAA